MTEMNGKIFVNTCGDKCMVLNEGYYLSNFEDVVVYASIDSDDETWYVREKSQFFSIYTEECVEREAE